MNDPIVIVSAKRTPIGHFGGCFKDTPAPTLGAHAIAALFEEHADLKNTIDQVYMGCVLTAGLGQAPARQAALEAGLSENTSCTTINKMCGSGLEAVILAHRALSAKAANIVVAGGMENMSRAPYLLTKARFGYRAGNHLMIDHMMHDGLTNAYEPFASMGLLAENCAEKFAITRELQDAYSINSFEKAQKATQKNYFKNEMAPVLFKGKTFTADEGLAHVNLDKISTLNPTFKKDGTITAANSSNLSDGASALLMMRASEAKKLKLTPIATIVAEQSIAHAPEWFSTAPITAIEKLMQKMLWRPENIDLFEINEAFAVVTLATMKALAIPIEKVNIHGGACVLGHPIGASGARILVTLIHALKQHRKKRGIAALCIGGGEAIAVAIEV